MNFRKFTAASTAALAASFATPAIVQAQQIITEVRGTVVDGSGAPVSGATVTVTDNRTGSSRVTTTGSNGQYSARNLTPGGPYSVSVTAGGFRTETIEGINTSVSSASIVSFDLETLSAGGASDEIIVIASRANTQQLAIGPSSTFSLETIEALPSISRDIRDIIRVDPRLTVTGGDNAVSCNGANNRFNSFTLDGVASNDAFGLNASGLPARANFPIPFDAIRETAVEFSPFDVEYGNFTGCNINIVTKSGTNEFHGAAFAVFNSATLTGDKINGVENEQDPFRDYNWGASVGGPIIKDKLFFYVSYEEIDDAGNIFDVGPEDGGFSTPLDGFTVAEAGQLQGIARDVYGLEAGDIPRTGVESSRRILTRGDWFITDNHRLEFTYAREREEEVESDLTDVDFQFTNSQEISGSSNNFYSARLFSQWNDSFSTQLWVSRRDNTDIQNPVGGGEAQDANPIPILNVDVGASDDVQVTGPGVFRSANDLQTQTDQLKFLANYNTGAHAFTAGYELNSLSVFNLFAPRSTGQFLFSSIEDFQNGLASDIRANGNGGDINDAAAEFDRIVHSIYLQDEWTPTDDLSFTLGLRYDFYTSDDAPTPSEPFLQRYGFSNSEQAFDGLSILQPRFAVNYDAGETLWGETQFRAGAGIFSGGDPTVWFSNIFSNNGIGLSDQRVSRAAGCTDADLQVIQNGSFTGIPQCLRDAQLAQTSQGNGRVDAIDPDFDIPSVIRGSIGFTHFTNFSGGDGFFDNWRMDMDVIYAQRRNAPEFRELSFSQTGELFPDGRSAVVSIDPLQAGCDATFIDSRSGFTGSDLSQGGPCESDRNQQDILLTNTDDGGFSLAISAAFQKRFDYDLFNRPASVNVNLGYAYTDAEDRQGTVSSQAISNFEETVRAISTQTILADSQFVNRHNVTLATTFSQQFVKDLNTRFSFFVSAREGRPFSYVFDNPGIFNEIDREDNVLLYVPNGPNDPNSDFSQVLDSDDNGLPDAQGEANLESFFTFLDESGLSEYAGQVAPRNAFRDPWFVDVDFRFQQDLPTPVDWLRTIFYIDVENVLNLISSDLNVLETFDRGDVGEGVPVIRVDDDLNAAGQYVFSGGLRPEVSDLFGLTDDANSGFQVNSNQSFWAVQFGLRFEF
ncbi:MAG: TonB-dependent receptor [Pseudomonadota bacterium]